MNLPPNGLPIYRLITGPDDSTFCRRVSEAINTGYTLYGSPSIAYDSDKKMMMAAQAVLWVGSNQ
jgi:hypothetical protein